MSVCVYFPEINRMGHQTWTGRNIQSTAQYSVAYQSVDSCLQNKVTVYQLSHQPACRVHFWSMEPQMSRMPLLGKHRLQLRQNWAFSRTLLLLLLLLRCCSPDYRPGCCPWYPSLYPCCCCPCCCCCCSCPPCCPCCPCCPLLLPPHVTMLLHVRVRNIHQLIEQINVVGCRMLMNQLQSLNQKLRRRINRNMHGRRGSSGNI